MGIVELKKPNENNIELKIVIACVISDEFIKKIIPIYQRDYIINKNMRKIIEWSIEYFKDYGRVPNKHIIDKFDEKKIKYEDAENELIQILIEKISVNFELKNFNDSYVYDLAVKYFKKRSLMLFTKKIELALENDKTEEAERIYDEYKKVEHQLSGWYNPFNTEHIKNHFANRDKNNLFKFPGVLGELVGHFKKGHTYVYLGIPKRGKTSWLQETALLAIEKHLRVVWFSFEMTMEATDDRIYKQITGKLDKNNDEYDFPYFDCLLNQSLECRKPNRVKNKISVVGKDYKICVDYKTVDHKICTECRGSKHFIPSVWYKSKKKQKMSEHHVLKKSKQIERLKLNNLRICVYLKFSAGFFNVERDLEILENQENFIPDVIILDSIQSMSGCEQKHDIIDLMYRNACGLAGSRYAALFTAHQGDYDALKKDNLDEKNVSGSKIGVLANVDGALFLSQSKYEKRLKYIRIGWFDRHGDFSDRQAACLQCRDYGKMFVDSEWHRKIEKKRDFI